ncbi:hypothetical protein [Hymenobacter crusticola]|uniref:Uncharacterized protein n=1 Tax=Hymenobacter crusticola TaxID=1770526 RepID=A0A243WHT1_9BACT|nr:hypothetical protein [Hymenobacter crusticola]OUJ74569.1 hypothetical protein BXP70_07265 [Hymenobacter crusticola]
MLKLCLLAITVFTLHSAGGDTDRTSSDNPPSIHARAVSMARALAARVNLEEGQYVKVKQLNEQMLNEVEGLKNEYAADQATLDLHLAATQTRYNAALLELLRPAQLSLYQQARSSMTALINPTK